MVSTSELAEVEAVLERLLPDPRGYAERLLHQAVAKWSGADAPDGTLVVTDPTLADSNLILASALGACECWGDDTHCVACGGLGMPGWASPDQELFDALVTPAVERHRRDTTDAGADLCEPAQPDPHLEHRMPSSEEGTSR